MEQGGGSYTNIVMGLSVSGYDIYVDESQYEEAKKILEQFIGSKNNPIEEDNDDISEIKKLKNIRNARQLLARGILIAFVASFVIAFILFILQQIYLHTV